MNKEQLVEEGIVIKSENGIAEIGLKEKTECEECSAKLFCSPGENSDKKIKALDPYNSVPGDVVRISIAGSTVLKATVFLYGVPLLLLVVFLVIGMQIFNTSSIKELYSFILAVVAMAVYYLGIYKSGNKNLIRSYLPSIISVQKH